jgi:hypothetical protein
MTPDTDIGPAICAELMADYFHNLVNMFFKILPMKEKSESSMGVYMESMLSEMLGGQHLVTAIREDAMYASLLFILQSLIDNPDWSAKRVKREVFRAISICNKLSSCFREVGEHE